MEKSERMFLKARLDAANREHQAQSHDKRVEHGLVRSDTEGQNAVANVGDDEAPSQPDPTGSEDAGDRP